MARQGADDLSRYCVADLNLTVQPRNREAPPVRSQRQRVKRRIEWPQGAQQFPVAWENLVEELRMKFPDQSDLIDWFTRLAAGKIEWSREKDKTDEHPFTMLMKWREAAKLKGNPFLSDFDHVIDRMEMFNNDRVSVVGRTFRDVRRQLDGRRSAGTDD